MTKPVTRKLAVDCLLWRISQPGMTVLTPDPDRPSHLMTAFRCTICGEPILPGQTIQFDHVAADVHGGEHGYRNLRPVHYDPCHKKKSAQDVAGNAKVKRLVKVDKPRKGYKIPSRPFAVGKRSFRGTKNARS